MFFAGRPSGEDERERRRATNQRQHAQYLGTIVNEDELRVLDVEAAVWKRTFTAEGRSPSIAKRAPLKEKRSDVQKSGRVCRWERDAAIELKKRARTNVRSCRAIDDERRHARRPARGIVVLCNCSSTCDARVRIRRVPIWMRPRVPACWTMKMRAVKALQKAWVFDGMARRAREKASVQNDEDASRVCRADDGRRWSRTCTFDTHPRAPAANVTEDAARNDKGKAREEEKFGIDAYMKFKEGRAHCRARQSWHVRHHARRPSSTALRVQHKSVRYLVIVVDVGLKLRLGKRSTGADFRGRWGRRR